MVLHGNSGSVMTVDRSRKGIDGKSGSVMTVDRSRKVSHGNSGSVNELWQLMDSI